MVDLPDAPLSLAAHPKLDMTEEEQEEWVEEFYRVLTDRLKPSESRTK